MQMSIAPSYRIEPGEIDILRLILVGCGGTGSFLALHLARLAWSMQGRMEMNIFFVDGDGIEAKNIGRQNFCPAEIGQSKSVSLAGRYRAAFGLRITPVVGFFDYDACRHLYISHDPREVVIFLGAVDGWPGRQEIARAMGESRTRRTWWIDGGNDHESGQVLVGNGLQTTISETGFCTELPRPDIQESELVRPSADDEQPDLGCADALASDAQNMMINQAMAGWMANYLYRLVVARDLDLVRSEIDLGGGAVRSEKIRQGEMRRVDGDLAGPPLCDMEICPQCGAELAAGVDLIDGFELDILFCPACDWRPENGDER